MKKIKWLSVILALAIGLAGCRGQIKQASAKKTAAKEITVAAAADLNLALPEIAKAYEKKTGNKITATFGASGLLATQIENGAPIDVFMSAGKKYTDQLVAKKLIVGAGPYATGHIVLIGKAKSLADLKSRSINKIAIANPNTAPYGSAAKQALEQAGILPAVQAKLVYGENISQTLEFVKTGNADAGFVALSLVKTAGIPYVAVNQGLYKPIEQWVGVTNRKADPKTSKDFMRFLLSPAAQRILKSYGFSSAN